jgi:SAM-dependent methyltransferase
MPADDEPIARAAYDELVDAYAVDVRENAYNAHLEFPATTSLLPDVAGERVLDAGCGTGVYSAWLVEHGAEVVGVDASEVTASEVPPGRPESALGSRSTERDVDAGTAGFGVQNCLAHFRRVPASGTMATLLKRNRPFD